MTAERKERVTVTRLVAISSVKKKNRREKKEGETFFRVTDRTDQ